MVSELTPAIYWIKQAKFDKSQFIIDELVRFMYTSNIQIDRRIIHIQSALYMNDALCFILCMFYWTIYAFVLVAASHIYCNLLDIISFSSEGISSVESGNSWISTGSIDDDF